MSEDKIKDAAERIVALIREDCATQGPKCGDCVHDVSYEIRTLLAEEVAAIRAHPALVCVHDATAEIKPVKLGLCWSCQDHVDRMLTAERKAALELLSRAREAVRICHDEEIDDCDPEEPCEILAELDRALAERDGGEK